MTEDWKDIKGFSGYQVSSLGRVRHVKLLTPLDDDGVLSICIRQRPNRKTFRIKRLVADYFLDAETIETQLITHIDGDKNNCAVDNLDFLPPR